MRIKQADLKTIYLGDSRIENIFVSEYMPEAPADFVKVFLALTMYAQCGKEAEADDIARMLMCSAGDVDKAIEYWCKAGVIKRTDSGLKILSMKEQLYGTETDEVISPDSSRRLMNDERIVQMFNAIEQYTKEYLAPQNMQKIMSWLIDYDTNCDVIEMAYKYCAEQGKTHINYVEAVVRSWAEKGVSTKEEIEELLQQLDRYHAVYRRVMKALGFTRNATEAEQRIISAWIDDLGADITDILDACSKTSGIPNPNVNYVDSVLRNRRDQAKQPVGRNLIMEYYERLRNEASDDAARRRREVYARVPEIEQIDADLKDSNMQLTRDLMNGSGGEEVRRRIEELNRTKVRLLTENDIPVDYMDIRPRCRICKDTGITKEGARCRCYEEVAAMAACASS